MQEQQIKEPCPHSGEGVTVAETAKTSALQRTPSGGKVNSPMCTPPTDPRSDTTEPLTPDHRFHGPKALFASPQVESPCRRPLSTRDIPTEPRNTIDDVISAVACMGEFDSSSACETPPPFDAAVAVKETSEERAIRLQLESVKNNDLAESLKQEDIVSGFCFASFESRHDIEVGFTTPIPCTRIALTTPILGAGLYRRCVLFRFTSRSPYPV